MFNKEEKAKGLKKTEAIITNANMTYQVITETLQRRKQKNSEVSGDIAYNQFELKSVNCFIGYDDATATNHESFLAVNTIHGSLPRSPTWVWTDAQLQEFQEFLKSMLKRASSFLKRNK